MRQPPQKALLSPSQHAYALAAVFITGAAVLLLEIVGTRLISPYYGSSIYCWSALITVTLVALAGGYNLGGRWADLPSLTLFSRLICLSGACVAVIPVLREPVLRATTPCGIQLGALASATVLVAPTLVLLAALGPLAIRLSTQAVAGVGRSAGDVYAVSTLGSVAGALLAGFVLVPRLPISQILYGLAVALLVLGAIGYHLSREKIPLAAALAAAAAAAFVGFWPRPQVFTNIVYSHESPYGQIKVMDFGDHRYLLINGTTQSMLSLKTLRTDSEYSQAMESAALMRPQSRRAAVIGIGAGLLTSDLERSEGLTVDSVDIDPDIIAVARRYFGFSPKGLVTIADGRTFLEAQGPAYSEIFFDAFSPEAPPYQLFTRESFDAAKRRLEPEGVLAVNLVTLLHGPHDQAWLSTLKTLRTVFANARAFQASDAYDDISNVVFLCSDGPLDLDAARERARPEIRKNLAFMAAHELDAEPSRLDSAVLMTDDQAPLESMLAETSVRWRRMLQTKIESVLLY